MIDSLIFVTLGLIGLWIGADFLIKGTKSIARHYGLPYFFIGLAFVSIGTSIPEIAVSVAGGIDRLIGLETSGIVIGNKIGSALSQISLILGILAFIVPLKMKRELSFKQGAFLILSVLLFFALASDGKLSIVDGWIAIIAYLAYYVYLYFSVEREPNPRNNEINIVENLVYAFLGLVLILFTSQTVVSNGIKVATDLGVHQSLIGTLLIGIGTGLPELSVTIASFRQRAMGISMGTLIGSNICDLLLSLGTGTVIAGFNVDSILLLFDLPVLLFLSFLIVYFFFTERSISRKEGTILILIYFAYAATKIWVTG